MLVLDSTCLLLAVNVFVDLQVIVSISLYLEAFWDFHVHVLFDWGLGVGHNKVDLLGVPTLDDGFGQDQMDGTLGGNWCIGVPIVLPFDLARSVNV